HEVRTTYRDSPINSEEVHERTWTPQSQPNDPVVSSISDNLAKDAKIGLGDAVGFNVQGVLMETTVASIRKVDWGQLQSSFTIVFPAGVLEQAPQFNVISTTVKDEASSADLQRDLVAQFPNVSILDLRQGYTIVEDIL